MQILLRVRKGDFAKSGILCSTSSGFGKSDVKFFAGSGFFEKFFLKDRLFYSNLILFPKI
jgi:hypothetical protein